MTMIYICPAHPELIVRDPLTMLPVPLAGQQVPHNSYWGRRLRDGEVVLVGKDIESHKQTHKKVKTQDTGK